MIGRDEIERMADQMGINPSHVQRDYVHSWLLSVLYTQSSLADKLVLKGGNSLRKGYFEHARYSRDLDFTTTTGISHEEIGYELKQACDAITARSGVLFDTERMLVEDKRRADKDKQIFEARLYFKDFYGESSELVLSVRMDVTQFDRLYLPTQSRTLIHPYSDGAACRAIIRCVKLEEILATKMRCLLQRRHIADLYDLAYSTLVKHDLDIDRAELISTFFKITIFGRSPNVAKGLLIDLPFDALSKFWGKFINCPAISRFSFDEAKTGLLSLVESLIPTRAVNDFSQIFYPSRLRNPIMEAADSMTMLKIVYDGVERLIEPYELAFKIRKDGVAREYLYVYDTTGGRTSPPGLKQFVPDKVVSIENTDKKFEPRYEVELKKAGGAEITERYQGKTSSAKRTTIRPHKLPKVFAYQREYTIQCPYCQKQFKRKTNSTTLNKHTNMYKSQCSGRRGFLVGIK